MPDSITLVTTALCFTTIAAAFLAIWHTNLIRAIAAFAVSSISLAATFFLFSSPYAGALELTVGAGLVAVLFLVALILSGGEETEVPS